MRSVQWEGLTDGESGGDDSVDPTYRIYSVVKSLTVIY